VRRRSLGATDRLDQVDRGTLAVVIPAWNAERYLGEAIESVLGQTVPVDSIVVVDDGSTDATAAVARRYPSVRLIQQAHAGAGAARNRGVVATDEALLAFLDADDVWVPHKLACQLPRLEEPGVGAVFGLLKNFLSPDVADVLGGMEFERRALRGFSASALVLPRVEWEQVGPFATGESLTDWVDWYLRLVESDNEVAVVGEIVVHRRIHGGNQTMRDPQARVAYARLVKDALDRRRRYATEQPVGQWRR
jgi:glycosyltransferase involved in cell wall biosynthesis